MVKYNNPFGQDIDVDKISTNGKLIFKDDKLIYDGIILNIPRHILYYEDKFLNHFDCNDKYIVIDQYNFIIVYKINYLIDNIYSYQTIQKNNIGRNNIFINQFKHEIVDNIILNNTCIIYDIETLKNKQIKTYYEFGNIYFINDLRFEYRGGIIDELLVFKNNLRVICKYNTDHSQLT